MEKMHTERLLLDLFEEDSMVNKNPGHISQLAVITVKSLMPMTDGFGSRIDYKRFTEEFKLWFYYKVGQNPSLTNIGEGVEPHVYWNNKDDSIISRLIPIIVANTKYEVTEEEIIKNTLFTTGNIESLLESLSIGQLLHSIVQGEENFIGKLKEKTIGLSQLEYLNKYEKSYRIGIEEYTGNFKVSFERKKIDLLNLLNGLKVNNFSGLRDCLNVLKGQEPSEFVGKILHNYLSNEATQHNLPRFYTELGDYIMRLRKGRIAPTQLEIEEYILPDIFSFKEGQVFYHSLLKESKVLKKEVRENTLTSLVQTRTGMYLFKK